MAVTRLATRLKERPLLRAAIAVAALVAAAALRSALTPLIGSAYPFITYFPAVMLVAFLSGIPHGVVVSAAGAVLVWRAGTSGSTPLVFSAYAAMMGVTLGFVSFVRGVIATLDQERAKSARLALMRETLFRELQHRVSNNFQIMSSLIRLQQGQVKDKTALAVLGETAARLQLLSKLHRQLHDPGNQYIPAGRFLRGIIDDVLVSVGAQNVTWSVQDDGTQLEFEQLSPVALIITEIISNSVEHGFAGRAGGSIRIAVARSDRIVQIVVRDDGVGLPASFSLADTTSLGMKIICSLAQQIGGDITLESDGGTLATLSFPLASASEQIDAEKTSPPAEPAVLAGGL